MTTTTQPSAPGGSADEPVTQIPRAPDPHLLDTSCEGDRVIVCTTASPRGPGVRRLPDRVDHEGSLVAFQVETEHDAEQVLRSLDRTGLTIYLDVEAKQDTDLLAVAVRTVQYADVRTIKPNDVTVDAAEAFLLDYYGLGLAGRSVAIFGTGNLGFKIALRLAERRARVQLFGRDAVRVARATAVINAIVPRHTGYKLELDESQHFSTLITAVAARGVVGADWLGRLEPESLILDVGINNLTADLIATAQAQRHTCARLDVRAAPYPVPPVHNLFFDCVMGRGHIAGHSVVAGGLIGRAGEVVVDRVPDARQVFGVADGSGGLLPSSGWSVEQRKVVSAVAAQIGTANA